MKAFWVASLVSLMAASLVMAQEEGRGRRKGGERMGPGARIDAILAQLNLDDKQQAEVAALRDQMRAEMQSAKGNKDAMRQAFANFRIKVIQILTPEQKQKFEELMAKRGPGEGKGKGPGGERKGEAPK